MRDLPNLDNTSWGMSGLMRCKSPQRLYRAVGCQANIWSESVDKQTRCRSLCSSAPQKENCRGHWGALRLAPPTSPHPSKRLLFHTLGFLCCSRLVVMV